MEKVQMAEAEVLPRTVRTPGRPGDPCIMVIFGAAGDLTRRKLIPALYNLAKAELLSREFAIVGVAHNPMSTDDFRKKLTDDVRQYAGSEIDPDIWEWFTRRLYYIPAEFDDKNVYAQLKTTLEKLDQEHATHGNFFFYLATAPAFFGSIVEQLASPGLMEEKNHYWRRVIIEKPFGHDIDSARVLNQQLLKVASEKQIYRIDHYLGKETVQNILAFRFANGIFEPIWNRRHIDHIQITVAESIGVENRGAFYEETGASRDFLQNHLLQLMSLVAMEPPATFDADALRDEKVKVIRAIGEMTPEQMRTDVVRGQYGPGWVAAKQVQGYRKELQVDPESETETYIAARFEVDDWRWSGVPFYLRTGKRLPKRATEIAIQFKEVPHRLFRESSTDPDPNLLAIRIQPDEGIMLRFGAKVPGLGIDVRSVTMDFTYGSAFTVDTPDAYETLILDALLGDASLFTRADEVEGAWARVTPIIDSWMDEGPPEFPNYESGTWGPEAADELLGREGRKWRRI
jgi:glucose-6-phosphate 1-dehydrogenase